MEKQQFTHVPGMSCLKLNCTLIEYDGMSLILFAGKEDN